MADAAYIVDAASATYDIGAADATPFFDSREAVDDFNLILGRARLGENWAVEAVFERYKGLVRAKSRSYFLIGADSEDLIQEGMIGLYKAIRDYKPDRHASFAVFADMCVTRQIITAIKTATRLKHLPLNTYISLSRPASGDDADTMLDNWLVESSASDPETMLIDRERTQMFRDDLNELLSDLEISVLSLYLGGEPYSVMSRMLGKPVKSIDNALQRVKRKLEKYLATAKKS
ncbi:MAG: RNA polymerase sporulation sigma factor SigH [Oscillospiraceae bacterium]|nr:RNA polymerase sporulation sigma factor SigH [Oscillospiraceae bacterium]